MQHDVSHIIVTQFTRSLEAFRTILMKAQDHAKERKFDENLFCDLKLAPDMLNFTRQVQIASDVAKFSVARLSGKDAPVFADDEKTFADLISRVSKTMEYLQGFRKEDFADYKSKKISFAHKPGVSMSGEEYLSSHAIPNLYFHITTCYALLRSAGVSIGKGDFLGKQNWI